MGGGLGLGPGLGEFDDGGRGGGGSEKQSAESLGSVIVRTVYLPLHAVLPLQVAATPAGGFLGGKGGGAGGARWRTPPVPWFTLLGAPQRAAFPLPRFHLPELVASRLQRQAASEAAEAAGGRSLSPPPSGAVLQTHPEGNAPWHRARSASGRRQQQQQQR